MALRQDADLSPPRLPLVLRWSAPESPLPVRPVRPAVPNGAALAGPEAPPWLATGPHHEPFDFCGQVRRLCVDVAARCNVLRHVDADRVLIGVTQARSARTHGLQARVTPLRCRGGSLTRLRHGVPYQVQRYFVGGREMLYLLTFCLPRFLDQDFDDKFVTLFHELYHISPAFDGDLRRYGGRGAFHPRSQRAYDNHMAHLARRYLSDHPEPALHDFLRVTFAQLRHRHGSVVGVMVPRPKLIPLVAR